MEETKDSWSEALKKADSGESEWYLFTIADSFLGIENLIIATTEEDARKMVQEYAININEDDLVADKEDGVDYTDESFKVNRFSDGSMEARVGYKGRTRMYCMKPVGSFFPPIRIVPD